MFIFPGKNSPGRLLWREGDQTLFAVDAPSLMRPTLWQQPIARKEQQFLDGQNLHTFWFKPFLHFLILHGKLHLLWKNHTKKASPKANYEVTKFRICNLNFVSQFSVNRWTELYSAYIPAKYAWSLYNCSKMRCTGKMAPPDENLVNAHSQHRQNFSSGPSTSNFWTLVITSTHDCGASNILEKWKDKMCEAVHILSIHISKMCGATQFCAKVVRILGI